MTTRNFRNRSEYATLIVRSIYGSDFRRRNYFKKSAWIAHRKNLLWANLFRADFHNKTKMEFVPETTWTYVSEDYRHSPEGVHQHRHDGEDWHPVAKCHPEVI